MLRLEPGTGGMVLFVLLFGAGFGVMTIARAALLGTYVPAAVYGSVSGGQALAANTGRVLAPLTAGGLITTAGHGTAFGLVAACSLATGVLLVAAERAHASPAPSGRTPLQTGRAVR